MSGRNAGALAFLLLGLCGCGNSTGSVSGQVSYEGKQVEKGYITFLPADGKGQSVGGEVSGGRYTVNDIPPGPKIVQIIETKDVPFARSTEEMKQRSEEQKKSGAWTGLIDPADVIPPDAVGNNKEVEIKSGKQEMNFELTKPVPVKGG
jgi:hypothetical protein